MKRFYYLAAICSLAAMCIFASCRKTTDSPSGSNTADPRDVFAASWQVHENQQAAVSGSSSHDYVVTVDKAGTAGMILMHGFAGYSSVTLNASTSGSNFTIPSQTVNVGTNITLSGSGSVSGNTISYTFATIRDAMYGGNATSTCTGTRK